MRQPPPLPASDDDTVALRRLRRRAGAALDRAYRERVDGQPRESWFPHLLTALADALSLRLAAVLRHHPGGTLELEASSSETLLWAELMRMPERWDGGVTGQGPAARALRSGEPVSVGVGDDGFLPWREAARRDRVVEVRAWPLNSVDSARVLLLFSGDAGLDPLPSLSRRAVEATITSGLERLLAADARLTRDALLSSALDTSGTASFITDIEGRIQWCNPAFTHLTGHTLEAVRGHSPQVLSSGRYGARRYRELWDTLRAGQVWRGETVDRDSAGRTFTALQTITPFGPDGRISHYLAQYQDVTLERAAQAARERQTGRDPLTGLSYGAALEHAVVADLAAGTPLCLVRLRVDQDHDRGEITADAAATVTAAVRRIAGDLGPVDVAAISPGDYLLRVTPATAETVAILRTGLEAEGLKAADITTVVAPADGTTLEALLRALEDRMARSPRPRARRRPSVAR